MPDDLLLPPPASDPDDLRLPPTLESSDPGTLDSVTLLTYSGHTWTNHKSALFSVNQSEESIYCVNQSEEGIYLDKCLVVDVEPGHDGTVFNHIDSGLPQQIRNLKKLVEQKHCDHLAESSAVTEYLHHCQYSGVIISDHVKILKNVDQELLAYV